MKGFFFSPWAFDGGRGIDHNTFQIQNVFYFMKYLFEKLVYYMQCNICATFINLLHSYDCPSHKIVLLGGIQKSLKQQIYKKQYKIIIKNH